MATSNQNSERWDDRTNYERSLDATTYDVIRASLGLKLKYTRKPQPMSGPVLHWQLTSAGFRCTAIWYGKRDVVHRESTFGTSLREAWLRLAAKGIITPQVATDRERYRAFVMLGR